jgi:hypothetical protein
MRGIYPVIATINVAGYQRIDDDELAQRTATLIERVAAQGPIGGSEPTGGNMSFGVSR